MKATRHGNIGHLTLQYRIVIMRFSNSYPLKSLKCLWTFDVLWKTFFLSLLNFFFFPYRWSLVPILLSNLTSVFLYLQCGEAIKKECWQTLSAVFKGHPALDPHILLNVLTEEHRVVPNWLTPFFCI